MNFIKSEQTKIRASRAFLKKGTCSRTFFYILNREFGHLKDDEERAIDPIAGGILQQGYQCGMLWGGSMGIGAESFRKSDSLENSISLTISATQHLTDSFVKRTNSIECSDITNTDFTNNWSFAKYMLSGKFTSCFRLAGSWGPEAVNAAKEALSSKEIKSIKPAVSCASEVVKKMGGTEEEMAMVAGFAGGLGLSGSGCGALVAAIWKDALTNHIRITGKSAPYTPDNNKYLKAFQEETDYEIECNCITGKKFNSIDEHTDFIVGGGCQKLLNLLASIK